VNGIYHAGVWCNFNIKFCCLIASNYLLAAATSINAQSNPKIRGNWWFCYEFCGLIVLAIVALNGILLFFADNHDSAISFIKSNNLAFYNLNINWKWNLKTNKQPVFCDCYCLFKQVWSLSWRTLLKDCCIWASVISISKWSDLRNNFKK